MRFAALLPLVFLAGCGAATVPLVSAGAGLLAGEAKLATALLQWMTVKDALPPVCAAVPVPPCIIEPAKP